MLRALSLVAVLASPGIADLAPAPVGAVRFFLVRHGQAFSNLDPEPDLPPAKLDSLTELGQSQSRAAAAALQGQGVRLVVSSPAGRAQGTAGLIREALGAPPVRVDERLRPLTLGNGPDGKPLDWDQRIAAWEAGRDPAPPGGESLEQVGARVRDALNDLAKAKAGSPIVLVAHGEVIGAFLGLVAGTPPAKRYPPDLRNGSLTVVDVAEGKLKVLLSNYVAESQPAKP